MRRLTNSVNSGMERQLRFIATAPSRCAGRSRAERLDNEATTKCVLPL